MSLLIDLQRQRPPASAGSKALNLYRLYRSGKRIPRTFVCRGDAYKRYLANDVSLVEELRRELARNLASEKLYAVRSSANIEDSLDRSFAGQFKSVLNVRGVDAILQAVWSIWGTARSDAVRAYLERQNVAPQQLLMGVVIQEMVRAQCSGVALSRNPVTGADEVVVESVQGLGDALVQGGVTPQRWVNKWGSWLVKPQSDSTPLQVIQELVDQTKAIAKRFKSQVDIEWAYDGRDLYFLQMRDITTLSRHNVYSNHISKEMLPGIIKPLIGSVNLPLVGGTMIRLLHELTSCREMPPEDLIKLLYYRVYFNMGALGRLFEEVGMPAESVELMMNALPEGATKPSMRPTMKTLLRLPTMLKFAIEKWNFTIPMRRALPVLQSQLDTFDYKHVGGLTDQELVAETERLYKVLQQLIYYNKTCQILMGMFNLGLKRSLAKRGVDFKDFDLMEDYAGMEAYDPIPHLHELNRQFQTLSTECQQQIRNTTYSEFMAMTGLGDFQSSFSTFLEQFGHLSDNGNDFSVMPWRESPDMVKQLIADFVPDKQNSGSKVRASEIRMSLWMRALYERAREFRFLREQVSSMYTFGYGLFRYYYLAMGRSLARRGWLETADDIFYLTRSEVRQAMLSLEPLADYGGVVRGHKLDIERYRNIPLPSTIYGDAVSPIPDPSLEKLVGIPTSVGCYTGRTVSVRGIRDFPKVNQGNVLVIPYSDVSWIPLFARVGAVISESGGLLSHSSIVAREYNIPAVVSAEGAMRLKDQTLVTVNGQTGEIVIHRSDEETVPRSGVDYASP